MTAFPRKAIAQLILSGKPSIKTAAEVAVWNLNLDQIESGTGRVLDKKMVALSELGPSTYPFAAGTVLYSKLRPYLNKVLVADADGCATTELVPLQCDPAQVLPTYLAYYLRSPEFLSFANTVVAGAKMPRMVMSEFWSYEIPLPPLPEQCRITAILDKADALRTKRREAIAKLDQLLQSVFLEMFGDPVTNPKGWPIRLVGDCCEKVTVGIVVKPASYYVDAGIPAIRSLNIGVNRILDREFVYFSEQDNFGPLKKTILRAGDVVAVRSGQPGKAAVIPPEFDGANAIDVLIARTKLSILLPEFLAHFLNSSAGKKLVLAEQRGQVQKHLNVKQLAEAEIPLPPLSEQKKFLTFAIALSNLEAKLKKASDELEAAFFGIQSRAFAGGLFIQPNG